MYGIKKKTIVKNPKISINNDRFFIGSSDKSILKFEQYGSGEWYRLYRDFLIEELKLLEKFTNRLEM